MFINSLPQFNKIYFRSSATLPEEPVAAPTEESKNKVIITKDMLAGIMINPDLRDKTLLENLTNIENKDVWLRECAWRNLANMLENNNSLLENSPAIAKNMMSALGSDNLRERTYATRVFRVRSKDFPQDEELTQRLIKNLKKPNTYLKNITASAIRNRIEEDKLTDENINSVLPKLISNWNKETERSDIYVRTITAIYKKGKLNKENVENLASVVSKKIYSEPTNTGAKLSFELLEKLDSEGLSDEPFIKYLSEGLQFTEPNKYKRALYYLTQNQEKIDEKNVQYISPYLSNGITSTDPMVKGQTTTFIRYLNSNSLLSISDKEKLKPMLVYNMGDKNPIVACNSAILISQMLYKDDKTNINFSSNINNIISNLDSDNVATQKTITNVFCLSEDILPPSLQKYVLNKALSLCKSENEITRVNGYKILKTYVDKYDNYSVFHKSIDNILMTIQDIEAFGERNLLYKSFDKIYDTFSKSNVNVQELSKKVCDNIEKQGCNPFLLPCLKTMIKHSAITPEQASVLWKKMVPLIDSNDERVKTEALLALGKLTNKHLLSDDENQKVVDILNNVSDVSDASRATFERELITKNNLSDDNKERIIASLYDNLQSDDNRTFSTTLRYLPDLYTRNVLPKEIDENILSPVVAAIHSEDLVIKDSAMKAFGDMAQLGVVRQEDVDECLPIIKEEMKNPSTRISGGIAVKTFGEFAYKGYINKDDISEFEPIMYNYMSGKDLINKTIAVESLANVTKISDSRLEKKTINKMNQTIQELFTNSNIATRGSLLKAMTYMEHGRILNNSLSQRLLPEILEHDLFSPERRQRSKAINFLRFMKLHGKLTEEQLKDIDVKIEQVLKDSPNDVTVGLITAYKNAMTPEEYQKSLLSSDIGVDDI